MQIEDLETRVCLSVSLFNGQLAIVGSTKADSVSLDAIGNTLALVFNGNTSNFSLAQVNKISISAGAGNDSVNLSNAVTIPAIIHGGAGNDSLRGGGGPDSLLGEAGNDTLDGAGGADVMFGGAAIDTVDYSARTNALVITIDDNPGDGEAGENDNIGTGVENIISGSGNDKITGSAFDNSLNGNGGNDTLLGGTGNDIIDGGLGTDSMSGGDGLDTVTYASRTAGVSINPTPPFGAPNSGEPSENDSILDDFETLVGGSGNDTIAGFQFSSANPPSYLEIGNAGNDTLTGGFGNDTLRGGAGDDKINGYSGDNNLMDGGDGNDDVEIGQTIDGGGAMFGGAGNDTLRSGLSGKVRVMRGGPGDDVLGPKFNAQLVTGDAGNDVANFDNGSGLGLDTNLAGTGIDTIIGTVFKDHIVGSDANEVILGLFDNDTIEGNGGDDYIDGGLGVDSLSGGAGDDVFVNGDGLEPDAIDGGDGFDSAQFGGFLDPVHGILVDTYLNVEFIYDPETGAQTLGTLLPNSATPLAAAGGSLDSGVLTITGTSGDDSISVILDSSGQNIQLTFNGVATLYPVASVKSISIDAGNGDDEIALIKSNGTRAVRAPATVLGGSGNDTITGGAGRDVLKGEDGDDSIRGGDDNDSIVGGLGDDIINGENGNDILNGGTETLGVNSEGADKINGGSGNDSVVYSYRTDPLTVDISDSKKSNDGGKSESDNVAADIENVFSGDGNDSITGNSSSNLICGGGGNDTLAGGDGNDKLIGSRGDDKVLGEGGINLFSLADQQADQYDGVSGRSFVSADLGLDTVI